MSQNVSLIKQYAKNISIILFKLKIHLSRFKSINHHKDLLTIVYIMCYIETRKIRMINQVFKGLSHDIPRRVDTWDFCKVRLHHTRCKWWMRSLNTNDFPYLFVLEILWITLTWIFFALSIDFVFWVCVIYVKEK